MSFSYDKRKVWKRQFHGKRRIEFSIFDIYNSTARGVAGGGSLLTGVRRAFGKEFLTRFAAAIPRFHPLSPPIGLLTGVRRVFSKDF